MSRKVQKTTVKKEVVSEGPVANETLLLFEMPSKYRKEVNI